MVTELDSFSFFVGTDVVHRDYDRAVTKYERLVNATESAAMRSKYDWILNTLKQVRAERFEWLVERYHAEVMQ